MFKKGMRKAIAVLVILTMIFTFVGCETKESNVNQPQESKTKYKAGTYTSSATGMNSDVKVEVIFSGDKIDSIKILEHKETAGIADAPIKSIPEKIVANQSLSKDTVSGATMTSKAILKAVEDCVKQAGGNVDELMVKIENTTDTIEEFSYDIVVIGAGAAGSAAALAASENSNNVLLLEKTGSPMGAASLAGGMFAAESKLQKEAGKTVDKEWLYDKYMEASNGFMNSVLVRTIIEESSKTVDWLLDNNMELNLVDSGSGLSFANVGKPTTLHGYNEGGIVALTKLIKEFEANNGTVMFSTPATELLTDENGGVAGVIATKEDGSKIKINSKAVIIATGGFGGNKEMLKEVFKDNFTIGQVATNTGDGIKMAWSAGAAENGIATTHYFAQIFTGEEIGALVSKLGPDFYSLTDITLYPYLRVNNQGKRFCDETTVTDFATHGAQIQLLGDL